MEAFSHAITETLIDQLIESQYTTNSIHENEAEHIREKNRLEFESTKNNFRKKSHENVSLKLKVVENIFTKVGFSKVKQIFADVANQADASIDECVEQFHEQSNAVKNFHNCLKSLRKQEDGLTNDIDAKIDDIESTLNEFKDEKQKCVNSTDSIFQYFTKGFCLKAVSSFFEFFIKTKLRFILINFNKKFFKNFKISTLKDSFYI